MKHLNRILFSIESLFFAFLILFSFAALAQDVVSPAAFLDQVIAFIQSWGGLSKVAMIAGIITVLISSMKVTALNQAVWAKLGAWQAWVGPIMGLAAGILGLGQTGPITPASIFAYVTAGAGAIIIHELLDTVKALPGIGTLMKWAIDIAEQFFHGPSSNAPSAVKMRLKKADELSKQAYELKNKH